MPGVSGCSPGAAAYDAILQDMTRPLDEAPDLAELVRFATLAANGHNTQPWRFAGREGGVDIGPDFSRRTPVADPDDHHLFASLGCAAENLSLAARARGMSGEARFEAAGAGRVHVDLAPAAAEETELFAAIPARQCSRALYDGKAASAGAIARLEAAARVYGVEPVFVTEPEAVEKVLSLVIEGNSRQMDDAAFVAELKDWIRFNANAAALARDGLYTASSGNPTVPTWLGPILFDLMFSKDDENAKYTAQVRSSAGLVVLAAASDDKAGWVAAGRACQRFALQATADGLTHAFVNQAVEVPDVRRELQALLGLGARRPDLVLRFGNGPALPRSLRRAPAEVIVTPDA